MTRGFTRLRDLLYKGYHKGSMRAFCIRGATNRTGFCRYITVCRRSPESKGILQVII